MIAIQGTTEIKPSVILEEKHHDLLEKEKVLHSKIKEIQITHLRNREMSKIGIAKGSKSETYNAMNVSNHYSKPVATGMCSPSPDSSLIL